MDRAYRNVETLQDVAPEDRVKAYQYGREYVPFSAADEAAMKFTTDRCMKLLGFTSRKNVPRTFKTGWSHGREGWGMNSGPLHALSSHVPLGRRSQLWTIRCLSCGFAKHRRYDGPQVTTSCPEWTLWPPTRATPAPKRLSPPYTAP